MSKRLGTDSSTTFAESVGFPSQMLMKHSQVSREGIVTEPVSHAHPMCCLCETLTRIPLPFCL